MRSMRILSPIITAGIATVLILGLRAGSKPDNQTDDIVFPSGIHGYCYWSDSTRAEYVEIFCKDTLDTIFSGNSGTKTPVDWYLASKDYPTNRNADFYLPYGCYYVKGRKLTPDGVWYSNWYGPIYYNAQNEYPEQDIYLTHFEPGK